MSKGNTVLYQIKATDIEIPMDFYSAKEKDIMAIFSPMNAELILDTREDNERPQYSV